MNIMTQGTFSVGPRMGHGESDGESGGESHGESHAELSENRPISGQTFGRQLPILQGLFLAKLKMFKVILYVHSVEGLVT